MQPAALIKKLNIIHGFLCFGLALFGLFAYLQIGGFQVGTDTGNMLIYLVPIIAITGYFASKYLFQKLVGRLPNEASSNVALRRYQFATLIKFGLLAASAFLAIFAYYKSGDALHFVIGVSLTTYIVYQRPSLRKLNSELPLRLEEEKESDTLNG